MKDHCGDGNALCLVTVSMSTYCAIALQNVTIRGNRVKGTLITACESTIFICLKIERLKNTVRISEELIILRYP